METGYMWLLWLALALFAVWTFIRFIEHKFKYLGRNDRFCMSCNQHQVRVPKGKMWDEEPETYVWVDQGRMPDPNCHCHDYTHIPECD